LDKSNSTRAIAFKGGGELVAAHLGDVNGTAVRTLKLPTVPAGNPERLLLWAEIVSGQELKSTGELRTLDIGELRQRRQRLLKLGGPL
jgi:hypothetical protein